MQLLGTSTSWASLVGKAFWKSQMFYFWNTVAADLQREQLQISQFQARDFAKSLSAPSAFSSLCIPSHLSNGIGGIFLYGLKYFKSLKLFKLALILKRQLTHDKRRGGFWQLTTASHLLNCFKPTNVMALQYCIHNSLHVTNVCLSRTPSLPLPSLCGKKAFSS